MDFQRAGDLAGPVLGTNITLGGNIHPVLVNAGLIAPCDRKVNIMRKGSNVTVEDRELGVLSTAIMTYNLLKDPNKIQLTANANFTPYGLSPFANQVGCYWHIPNSG